MIADLKQKIYRLISRFDGGVADRALVAVVAGQILAAMIASPHVSHIEGQAVEDAVRLARDIVTKVDVG